jgi:hypothetical protein
MSLVAACSLSSACAPHRGAAPPTQPAEPPLHEGPLTDFVPAAGLRWMIVARLAELAHTPALAPAIELLFPGPRLAGFAISTGIDLRTVSVALAAGFDYSTLYVAESRDAAEGELVESRFADRLAGGARLTAPQPSVRRLSGVLGVVPQTLVRVRGHLVAVSVGDPTPARVVELYARGLLGRSPTALRGSALSMLPASLSDAPLSFYAPGPFTAEWAAGARGLLGAAVALGVTARVEGESVSIQVFITGRFESMDAERLGSAWADLADSSMGKLLGLDGPENPPQTSATPDQLSLQVRLPVMPLASGLRAAVAADVWEMLEVPPPGHSPSPQVPSSPRH